MEDIKNVKAEAKENGIKIDVESEKSWHETLKGLKMAEDEYWKSEDTINGYQEALAIARLRSKLAEDWGISRNQMVIPDGIDKFENSKRQMKCHIDCNSSGRCAKISMVSFMLSA